MSMPSLLDISILTQFCFLRQIARPRRKYPADKLILDRRERDWLIDEAQDYLGSVKNCDVKTLWENRSDKKIERNIVRDRMNKALQANEFTIEDRRDRRV